MLAIYNSQEVSGVAVACNAWGAEYETISDEEGYFSFNIAISEPLPSSTRWEAVSLRTPGWQMPQQAFEVPVLAPGNDDHWGVISDIDDTIIETGATDLLKNWRRVLVDRPQDRIPVPGASSLYGMIAQDHASP